MKENRDWRKEFNSHFFLGSILSNIEKQDKLSKNYEGKVECDKVYENKVMHENTVPHNSRACNLATPCLQMSTCDSILVPPAILHHILLDKNLIIRQVLLSNNNFSKANGIIYILSTFWFIFRDKNYLIMSI